jgi:DNA-binding protein H-NS
MYKRRKQQMTTYKELKAKATELDALIEKAREAEFDSVLEEIRTRVREFRFTPGDVFGEPRDQGRIRSDKRPRYRNPENGVEWSGMGREPFWIKGKDRKQFEIK